MSDTPFLQESDRVLLQRERALEATRHTCEALHNKLDANDLAKTGLQIALDLTGTEGGAIFLYDVTMKALKLLYSLGLYQLPDRPARRTDDKLFREVLHGGQATLVPNGGTTIACSASRGRIVTPLKRWNGPAIGVIDLVDRRTGWLEETDMALLTIVSALTAGAIERAHRHARQTKSDIEGLMTFIGKTMECASYKSHQRRSNG